MKTIISLPRLGITALVFVMLLAVSAASTFAQGGGTSPAPQTPAPAPSQGETAAIEKVKAATDANGAMLAATDFIKNFPTSAERGQVGDLVAGKIIAMPDGAPKTAMSERMMTLFTGTDEVDGLFDGLEAAKQYDEMFKLGAMRVEKVQGEVKILTQLALAGSTLARQNNRKYISQTEQYGLKAISLIESGTKPAGMPDSNWAEYKTKLPALYQCIASIEIGNKKPREAQKLLQKVLALGVADAYTYLGLADISNEDYAVAMQEYKDKGTGPDGNKLKTKAINLLTQTMDLYGHAAALSEGNPQMKDIHDSAMSGLEPYFKFLNNNSTAGMQDYINKFKKPATP